MKLKMNTNSKGSDTTTANKNKNFIKKFVGLSPKHRHQKIKRNQIVGKEQIMQK